MTLPGVILCAIPGRCWKSQSGTATGPEEENLQRFLPELASIERRLAKGVGEEDESGRHARVCAQIELNALRKAAFAPHRFAFDDIVSRREFPAIRIDGAYMELILRARHGRTGVSTQDDGRIGASIFHPQELPKHVGAFEKLARAHGYNDTYAVQERLWFLKRWVIPRGLGLVEFSDALSEPNQPTAPAAPRPQQERPRLQRWFEQFYSVPEMRRTPVATGPAQRTNLFNTRDAGDWKHYGGVQNRGGFMEERLRAQITDALQSGASIRLCDQRHNMTIKILQEFIHAKDGVAASNAPMTYDESKTPAPFPLRCLRRLPATWEMTEELHVGLVSMRHLPIDQYIDINWYRNAEIPSSSGLAHADEFCFRHSLRQLAELLDLYHNRRLQLSLYHAGYLPAVLGFYRALVVTLASGKYPHGCLQVIPKFQPAKDGGFEEGFGWPESETS